MILCSEWIAVYGGTCSEAVVTVIKNRVCTVHCLGLMAMACSTFFRTFDIIFVLCSFLDLPTMIACSGTCKDARAAGEKFSRVFLFQRLLLYTNHPLDIITQLRTSQAFIGGDVAVDLAAINLETRHLMYRTLTIFVPQDGAVEFRGILRREGYYRLGSNVGRNGVTRRGSEDLVIDCELAV